VGTLIESSVLIAAERWTLDLDDALDAHAESPVGIASITASELLPRASRFKVRAPADRLGPQKEHPGDFEEGTSGERAWVQFRAAEPLPHEESSCILSWRPRVEANVAYRAHQ